ncbi:MAG: hypothetical protein LBI17_00370 [Rickettsiales bacterium]|jgi:hypothetical protein|nr:hypothetical protein [Rickettsiales bacterium]
MKKTIFAAMVMVIGLAYIDADAADSLRKSNIISRSCGITCKEVPSGKLYDACVTACEETNKCAVDNNITDKKKFMSVCN